MTDINDIKNQKPFVLAEIGLNHNKDVDLACKMIDSGIASGVDGVKFQTFITEGLMTKDNGAYQIFKDLELSASDFAEIAKHCQKVGTNFVSTPFCHKTADLLASLNVNAFKIASSDINYLDLISHVASFGKAVILSTGMSDYKEIDNAVNTCLKQNNRNITILHCISQYPPKDEDLCLNAISVLKNRYSDFRIGFSDHTSGFMAAALATALGATFFEKHFTSDKNLPGPDQKMSTDPAEMTEYVNAINSAKKMTKILSAQDRSDMCIAPFARRSLFASADIKAGTAFSMENITALRPGDGISVSSMNEVLGKVAAKDIKCGTKLAMDDIK